MHIGVCVEIEYELLTFGDALKPARTFDLGPAGGRCVCTKAIAAADEFDVAEPAKKQKQIISANSRLMEVALSGAVLTAKSAHRLEESDSRIRPKSTMNRSLFG